MTTFKLNLTDRAEILAEEVGMFSAAQAAARSAVGRLAHVEPTDVCVLDREPADPLVAGALDRVREVARGFVTQAAIAARGCGFALLLELERVAEREARLALEVALVEAFGAPAIDDEEPAPYRPAAHLPGGYEGEYEGRPLLECGACRGSGGGAGELGCRFCEGEGVVASAAF